MHRFATRFRYGSWDGSQQAPLSADDVLGAIAEDLIERHGDRMAQLLGRQDSLDSPTGFRYDKLLDTFNNAKR